MKLIKLVYIAHAWSLAFFKKQLIEESVQAWKYGPVIQSLYHAFKHYGNASIPIKEADSLPSAEFDAQTRSLLEKVWEKYGDLSALHLSALSHQRGTPWDTSWNKEGGKDVRYKPIPNELIQTFYLEKLAQPAAGSGH